MMTVCQRRQKFLYYPSHFAYDDIPVLGLVARQPSKF
jgi:hypothetical protein